MNSDWNKVQLVFLVDTRPPFQSDHILYHRSLCLACTRILLYLNQFPIREHLSSVQWNYHFFNSLAQERSLVPKTSQFCETRSEILEKFFSNFLRILETKYYASNKSKHIPQQECRQQRKTGLKPVRLVYNALGAVVQDYIWDAPEIKSPVRQLPRTRGKRGQSKSSKTSSHLQLQSNLQRTRNYIFICSSCPKSEGELRSFCIGEGRNTSNVSTKDLLSRELFPGALVTQFEAKGISVHWINTGVGDMGGSIMTGGTEASVGLSIMSEVLKKASGTLIPMSILISPLSGQLAPAHHHHLHHSHTPDEREAPREDDGDGVHTKEIHVRSSGGCEPQTTIGTSVEAIEHAPVVPDDNHPIMTGTTPSPELHNDTSGVENISNRAPSEPAITDTIATTSSLSVVETSSFKPSCTTRSVLPSKRILSSLALPTASLLRDYLESGVSSEAVLGRSTSSGVPSDIGGTMDKGRLFWLCTRGGEIVCILQLHSMCGHHPLSPLLTHSPSPSHSIHHPPPPLSFPSSAVSQQQPNQLTTTERTAEDGVTTTSTTGHVRRYSLTGAPLENQVRQPNEKSCSKSSGMKTITKKKLNFSKNDPVSDHFAPMASSKESDTQNCGSDTMTECSTHGTMCFGGGGGMCNTPDSVVALGLVKQTDVPLSWMSPTSVCSCTGLYVPRAIRNNTRLNSSTKQSVCISQENHRRSSLNDRNKMEKPSSLKSPTTPNSLKPLVTKQLFKPPSSPNPLSATKERLDPTCTFSATKERCDPTCTSSPPATTTYNGLHMSPIIHLYRHPISPPHTHSTNTLSALTGMKRSISVPELCEDTSSSLSSENAILGTPPFVGNGHVNVSVKSPKFSKSQRERILKRLSRTCLKVRCRRVSVPLYAMPSPKSRGGKFSLHLSGKRGTSVRSASLSPRYPLLKLKDVLSYWRKETNRLKTDHCSTSSNAMPVMDPSSCLAESGLYHSRQYLNLCLWLAKNRLLLLVSIQRAPGRGHLALLQPITSLVSTLTLTKPQFSSKLLQKLVSPPNNQQEEKEEEEGRETTKNGGEKAKKDSSDSLMAEDNVRDNVGLIAGANPNETTASHQQKYHGNSNHVSRLQNKFDPNMQDHENVPRKGNHHTYMYTPQDVFDSLTAECSTSGNGGDDKSQKDCDRGSINEPSHQDRFLASTCVSDPELYVNLQLLFTHVKSSEGVPSAKVNCTLFSSLDELPPFTNLSLLPWFPYTDACGLDRKVVQRLQDLQSDSQDDNSGSRSKALLITALKDLYSSTAPGHEEGDRSHDISHDLTHDLGDNQDQEMEVGKEVQEGDPVEELQTQGEGENDVPRPSTIDELFEWFHSIYEEEVQGCADGDNLLRWAAKTLSQFCEDLKRIEDTIHLNQERLWELLNTHVLLSSVKLGEKYEALSSSSRNSEGATGSEAAPATTEGTCSSLSDRRTTEYLLQILLHFECIKLCSTVEIDSDTVANQLISLLRKFSFLTNPGLFGNSLKKIILPMYLSSCQGILIAVYDGLHLPLPSDLYSSPDLPSLTSPSPLAGGASEASAQPGGGEDGPGGEQQQPDGDGGDCTEEEEGTPGSLMSLEEPLARKGTELGTKKLFRHQSFQEVSSHRQITIPSRAAGRKERKKKRKTKKSSQLKPSSNVPSHPRRSPRIAKLPETSGNPEGKGVCRTLFTRHHTIGGGAVSSGNKSKRKRESEGEDGRAAKRLKGVAVQRHHTLVPDILVKETPVKKQVDNYRRFKLQRLRSKSSVVASPGVEVIQESPRRSFYSVPKPPQPKTTPLFKTPPLKESKSTATSKHHLSPNLSLKKEPSPAALHSLLHGHLVSPGTGDQNTIIAANQDGYNGYFTSPLVHRVTDIHVSPDLFEVKEHKTSIDINSANAAGTNIKLTHNYRGSPCSIIATDAKGADNQRGSPSIISPDMFTPSKSTPLQSVESPLATHSKNIRFGSNFLRTQATSTVTATASKQPNYRSARMLTYESESPLKTSSKTQQVDILSSGKRDLLDVCNGSSHFPTSGHYTSSSVKGERTPSISQCGSANTIAPSDARNGHTHTATHCIEFDTNCKPSTLNNISSSTTLLSTSGGVSNVCAASDVDSSDRPEPHIYKDNTNISFAHNLKCPSPTTAHIDLHPTRASGDVGPFTDLRCDSPILPRENSSADVVFVSPPPPPPTGTNTLSCGPTSMLDNSGTAGVCLLTDLDPSIENESASMMAFALSTPPKDNPKDFHQAFSSYL